MKIKINGICYDIRVGEEVNRRVQCCHAHHNKEVSDDEQSVLSRMGGEKEEYFISEEVEGKLHDSENEEVVLEIGGMANMAAVSLTAVRNT